MMKEKKPQPHSAAPTILGSGREKGEAWELLNPISEGYLVPAVRCQMCSLECGCRTANSAVVFFMYFLHCTREQRENNTKETFPFDLNFLFRKDSPNKCDH